jgi:hypothetical protein
VCLKIHFFINAMTFWKETQGFIIINSLLIYYFIWFSIILLPRNQQSVSKRLDTTHKSLVPPLLRQCFGSKSNISTDAGLHS